MRGDKNMIEFAIGYLLGMSVTFIILLFGTTLKEVYHEKKKTSHKIKKSSQD